MVLAADVYKAGVLAGRLSLETDGATKFVYIDGYAGPAVASTLPVSDMPVVNFNGALPNFFTGLLPEGLRLIRLQQKVKSSQNNELAQLLEVGSDVPGDVQIVHSGAPLREIPALASASFDELIFTQLSEVLDHHSIPGVQEKASARMISVPTRLRNKGDGVTDCPTDGILKMNPGAYPHLVLNEFMHLRTAKQLGMGVSMAQLVSDSQGELGVFVKRFDRICVDGIVHRLACEDASQILDIPPVNKYAVSSEIVTERVAALCDSPLVAKRNLFMQFLFAWLTGNGDLHAKNISILQNAGRWEVAPIYDVPCTLIYGDNSLALTVNGKVKRLKMSDWLDFASEIGLPATSLRRLVSRALHAAKQVAWDELPFSGSPLHSTQRELRARHWVCEDWLNA